MQTAFFVSVRVFTRPESIHSSIDVPCTMKPSLITKKKIVHNFYTMCSYKMS
ncbi:hypothetical protein PGB90_007376 [Kerria lacca]